MINDKYDRSIFGFDYEDVNWLSVFGIYLIYSTALVHYSMFLTTFFSKSKTANEVTTFILVASIILPFFGFVESC